MCKKKNRSRGKMYSGKIGARNFKLQNGRKINANQKQNFRGKIDMKIHQLESGKKMLVKEKIVAGIFD